jgi:hypothetical protein
MGQPLEVDLIQYPIPLVFLFSLSPGHVCSFGISTTNWPITQTLGQVPLSVAASDRAGISKELLFFKEVVQPSESV